MSGVDSVIDAIRKPFLDIATDISGSIVYLDAGAAEVAQLSLGPAFLLGMHMAVGQPMAGCKMKRHPSSMKDYVMHGSLHGSGSVVPITALIWLCCRSWSSKCVRPRAVPSR